MILEALITVLATLAAVVLVRIAWPAVRRRDGGLSTVRARAAGRLTQGRNVAPVLASTVPLPPPPVADSRQLASVGASWRDRPDLQPAQQLYPLRGRALVTEQPLGLTVTVREVGPASGPPQDAYYVQRNVVALARGLSAGAQRAAALSLSGVVTSPLGRSRDTDKALGEAMKAANSLVRSVARRDPEHADMAAALDVIFVGSRDNQPMLHFAHAGNGVIWLWRHPGGPLDQLTEPHVADGGQVMRAVGLAEDLVPQLGYCHAGLGDRVVLATASSHAPVPAEMIAAVAAAHVGRSLQDCADAVTEAVQAVMSTDALTIVVAELTNGFSLR